MKRILALAVLLAAASLPALAANFSGKWTLQSAAGRGGGRGATVVTLNQAGDGVTGTVSVRIDLGTASPINEEIWAGKVESNTISFYVWSGQDQPVKVLYTGTISAAGDEIAFTVNRGGAAQQMTARKVK